MKTLWEGRTCFAGREVSLPGRCNLYTITENELYWSTGLLSKEEDSLKIYNIEDVRMRCSFIDRIFGQGTIHIDSCDRSTPEMDLLKIKNPKKVLRLLNELIDQSARRNGIRRGRYQDYDNNADYPAERFDSSEDYYI